MLVDDHLVESAVGKPNSDVAVNRICLPGQSTERHAKDAAVIAAAPSVHSNPCGPSEVIESDGKGSIETPAVFTKTVPPFVENKDGNANHSLADKGQRLTDSGSLRDKALTCSASSQSPSVLELLEKNKTNTVIPTLPSYDLSDEVVCVKGPDIREVQREALQKARITDNVQKWADTFANANVDALVQISRLLRIGIRLFYRNI